MNVPLSTAYVVPMVADGLTKNAVIAGCGVLDAANDEILGGGPAA